MVWRFSEGRPITVSQDKYGDEHKHGPAYKRKELVLTVRQDLDDLLHLLLEPDFQDPVRLVDDERFQILENEGFGVLYNRESIISVNADYWISVVGQKRSSREEKPTLK